MDILRLSHPAYAYTTSTLLVAITALTGSSFTSMSVRTPWYDCIKPPITPPAYVFPIVWTILYVLIAYAFGNVLAIKTDSPKTRTLKLMLINLFVVNLIFNMAWTYFYFGTKDLIMSVYVILMLLATTCAIIWMAWKHVTRVAWCMVPYMVWISFATVLNIWSLQRMTSCI